MDQALRKNPAIPALSIAYLVLVLAGCAARAPAPAPTAAPLNSERIEQRFGSFGVEVLYQNPALRVSNLYSTTDGERVCRTFALVRFVPVPAALEREHELIQAGGSLGAVLKAQGWELHKRHLYLGEVPLEPRFTDLVRLMGGITAPRLAAHIYQLSVSRGGERHDYATIAEFHHPDYFDLAQLRAAYGVEPDELTELTPATVTVVDLARRFWTGHRPPGTTVLPVHHSPPGL